MTKQFGEKTLTHLSMAYLEFLQVNIVFDEFAKVSDAPELFFGQLEALGVF